MTIKKKYLCLFIIISSGKLLSVLLCDSVYAVNKMNVLVLFVVLTAMQWKRNFFVVYCYDRIIEEEQWCSDLKALRCSRCLWPDFFFAFLSPVKVSVSASSNCYLIPAIHEISRLAVPVTLIWMYVLFCIEKERILLFEHLKLIINGFSTMSMTNLHGNLLDEKGLFKYKDRIGRLYIPLMFALFLVKCIYTFDKIVRYLLWTDLSLP